MSSSSQLISCYSETKDSSVYSRKEKSLGLMCSNFLNMYDKDGVEFIELGNAATQLGVERRRIYDIVNILESIGVLTRKAKNQYTWNGYAAIPRTLEILKEEVLQEKLKASTQCNKLSGVNNNKQLLNLETGESGKNSEPQKVDGRKEKSLMILAQNFLKLFICSDEELISVEQVASSLLGDSCAPTAMKSRFRRVYDIRNVFVSLNLIHKVRHPDTGKPALKWIGGQGLCKLGSSIALNVHEPQKRAFGSDLTNTSSKRCKFDCSFEEKLTEKENVKSALNQNIKYNNGHSDNSLKQDQKRTTKEFVFGPFKPSSVLKREVSKDKNAEQVDLEKLAALIKPRYQNQAITDLFAHYVESWISWTDKAGGERRKISDPNAPFTTHNASSN